MCGIFGIFNPDTKIDEQTYKTAFMNGVGRGPESSVFQAIGTQAYLGFHRLAINGLNTQSNQPLQQGNLTLICNGEIYNYKKLYEILGSSDPLYEFDGEKFDSTSFEPRTQSDCEIILHLYRKFGIEQCLQLLDGVFAFILIDYDIYSDSAKMFVARDPFGVRPLYEMEDGDTKSMIGFASELKCLSPIVQMNPIVSDKNIRVEIPVSDKNIRVEIPVSDKNIRVEIPVSDKNIRVFVPGTYSEYRLGFKVSDSWKLKKRNARFHVPSVIGFDYGYAEQSNFSDMIRTSLKAAVYKRCAATERPVACLLSGGLDSSLITALVAEYHTEHELPYPLETYSIGLEGSVDLAYARTVADHLKTKHTEIVLQESDFLDAIPEVIRAIESYDTTTVRASIGNYLLGKYIREHSEAKVIFNGDGSDEVAGGYLYFQCAPNSVEFDLECRRLLRDIHLFDVLRSDKSISSHGLEPRTPFLDREFVQTYLSIPMDLRNHASDKKRTCEKFLLRSAFSSMPDLLPHEVLWRTKEAFSDGVSKTSRSLFEIIQEHVENNENVSNLEYYRVKYPHNPPKTWEQVYYREIFEEAYPGQGHVIPYMWMPQFVKGATDASARTLAIYSK
jgi:asparagine synthase (glutamine-hydrolysing)